MSDNEVTLVTGETVDKGLVGTVFMALSLLRANGQVMAIHTLLQLCRDTSHRPFGNTGDTLYCVGLLETWNPVSKQGSVWRAMIPIVLAAVKEVPGGVKIACNPRNIIRRQA